MPADGFEHLVGTVLQGDVKIFAHVGPAGHDIENVHGEVCRISVMKPYPFHPLDFGHGIDKRGQPMLAVQICTV